MEIESVNQVGNQSVNVSIASVSESSSGNTVKAVKTQDKPVMASNMAADRQNGGQNPAAEAVLENKKVAQSTIDSTMSDINSKIKMSNTQLQYSVDEDTQRISIKVIDQDTDKVIREIPPEETLEAIKKIWEIAGIIVDKKL
jgi:flagellar protein FlaG